MENQDLLILLKIFTAIIQFVLSFIFGYLPIKYQKRFLDQKNAQYIKCFSAGAFISIALLHLLPTASKNFKEQFTTDFIKVLLIIVSFSFVLIVQKVILVTPDYLKLHEHVHHFQEKSESEKSLYQNLLNNQMGSDCVGVQHTSVALKKQFNYLKQQKDQNLDEIVFKKMVSSKQQLVMQVGKRQKQSNNLNINKTVSTLSINEQNDRIAYILLLSLSFHGIFGGMTIGFQNNIYNFFNLLTGVVLHQCTESMLFGVSLVQNKIKNKTSKILIFINSIIGPIGILIGIFLQQSKLLVSITLSFTAGISQIQFKTQILTQKSQIFQFFNQIYHIYQGTFMYLATTEIISEEFSVSKQKWQKLFFFVLGFSLFSILRFYE